MTRIGLLGVLVALAVALGLATSPNASARAAKCGHTHSGQAKCKARKHTKRRHASSKHKKSKHRKRHKHKAHHKKSRKKPTSHAQPNAPSGCCASSPPVPPPSNDPGSQSPFGNLPGGTTLLGSVPGTPGQLFSPGSVWNVPFSGDVAPDPTSAVRIAAFVAEVRSEVVHGSGPWISETSYSTPFYSVGASQARVRVHLDAGSWAASLQQVFNSGVPIPAGAKPAAGTDRHMTIYQPSSDTLWEFWGARLAEDGWHAKWGGAMQHVSSNAGYYTSSAWPGLKSPAGYNWGSTATSLPVIGGTIRIDDLRHGVINHALALDIPRPCARVFTWPAQRTDGLSNAPDCIPEGARLRLDPTFDVEAAQMPPITRILARAAQRYGIIVRDQTTRDVGFYAEDPTPTGSDPYHGSSGFYGGLSPWRFLPEFPWEHLQLMPLKLCTKAPCER